MSRNISYIGVSALIEHRQIKNIQEIFNVAGKVKVCNALHMNFHRFNKAVHNPENFKIKELIALAKLFKADPKRLIDIAYVQTITSKRTTRKNKETSKVAKETVKCSSIDSLENNSDIEENKANE